MPYWLKYELCNSREKADILPTFVIEHFDLTGEKKLPLPRVLSTRKIGSTVHHRLVYEDDPTLDRWVPLANYTDLGDTVSLSCKTEKDRDKRSHRCNFCLFAFFWNISGC